jgi:DNA replication protein DnaC
MTFPIVKSFLMTSVATMSSADIVTQLRSLGFRLPGDTLRAFLDRATHARMTPIQMAQELVQMERRERQARNLAARTRLAALGKFLPLDRFDWNHPRRLDRALYQRLHSMDFVERGDNVLFRGPSGVGKTTLAKNLGLAALTRGYTVRFCTLAGMLTDLLRRDSLPALERRLRRYLGPKLLIVDSCGAPPYVELPTHSR